MKLRELLAPELEAMGDAGLDFQSDERMYRVYRTAGFSLEASVKYFRGMVAWRKKVGADEMRGLVLKEWREDFWAMSCVPKRDVFRKWYMFHPNHAETSEGELVCTESTGFIKVRNFVKEVNREDILLFWCCIMEWTSVKLTQLSKKHNTIARMIQIKDLTGLNLLQVSCKAAMGHFKMVNKMLHNMYPDTLNRLLLINTPKIFTAVWRMFKPILPEKTQKKITMVQAHSKAQTKELECWLPSSDPLLTWQLTSKVYDEKPDVDDAQPAAEEARLGQVGKKVFVAVAFVASFFVVAHPVVARIFGGLAAAMVNHGRRD